MCGVVCVVCVLSLSCVGVLWYVLCVCGVFVFVWCVLFVCGFLCVRVVCVVCVCCVYECVVCVWLSVWMCVCARDVWCV